MKSIYELPPELFSELDDTRTRVLDRNLLVSRGSHSLAFVRVPSAVDQKPIGWWSIPPFPFTIKGVAAHLSDIVLAVAEERER